MSQQPTKQQIKKPSQTQIKPPQPDVTQSIYRDELQREFDMTAPLSPTSVAMLQRTIGNQAMGQLNNTNSVSGDGHVQREEMTDLPSAPNLSLSPPSLQSPESASPYNFGLNLGLQLDPEIQTMMQQQVQTLVQPINLRASLATLSLGTMPSSHLNLTSSSTPEPEPLIPAGASPDTARPATSGDLMNAILAVPAVDEALTNLQTQALDQVERDWQRLNTGEKIGTVGSVAVIGLSALGVAMTAPESREWLLEKLNGRVVPVPGLNFLHLELNTSGDNLMFGLHLDVGRLFPKSLDFGPSSPQPIGAPPMPSASIQRVANPITAVQRQSSEGGEISTDIEQSIQSAKGSGQPLADTVRTPMENAFGTDFSGVNIHTNSQSNTLNQSFQARAFTTGQDVFFRRKEKTASDHWRKSRVVANPVVQKKNNGGRSFGIVDNRPENVTQRKLQKMVNNNPQVKQATQLQVIADNEIIQKSPRGAAAGAAGGALIGGAIGSVIPVVGTAIGGFLGGLLGSVAGNFMTQTDPLRRTYTGGEIATLIANSEGQANMVGNGNGHARQRHVEVTAQAYVDGFANNHPEQTKTAYLNNADQNNSATAAINSAAGQIALGILDTNPAIVRQVVNVPSPINNVVRVKGPTAAGIVRPRLAIVGPNVMFIFERTPANGLHVVTCYPRN